MIRLRLATIIIGLLLGIPAAHAKDFHVKGVKITFKPGTDRLISTPKDGFHCKHNAIGPGAAAAAISQGIRLKNCKDVVQETNKIA